MKTLLNTYLKYSAIGLCIALSGCANQYEKNNTGFLDVTTLPEFGLLDVDEFYLNDSAFEIDDRAIYKFTYLLEDALRKRERRGRVGEEVFAGIQVTLAALAAAFSGASVHPDLITGLSGLSALTPDIAQIINPGEKAKAYSQTLELIENANSSYISARTLAITKADDVIPTGKLTPEGASLFVSVVSSLKVLRDTLHATIPKSEDLDKATGKYALFSVNMNTVDIVVDRGAAALAKGASLTAAESTRYQTEVLSVKGGKIASCSSQYPGIVAITGSCVGQDRVVLSPKQEGSAVITLVSESGYRTSVDVTVK